MEREREKEGGGPGARTLAAWHSVQAVRMRGGLLVVDMVGPASPWAFWEAGFTAPLLVTGIEAGLSGFWLPYGLANERKNCLNTFVLRDCCQELIEDMDLGPDDISSPGGLLINGPRVKPFPLPPTLPRVFPGPPVKRITMKDSAANGI